MHIQISQIPCLTLSFSFLATGNIEGDGKYLLGILTNR